MNSLCFVNRICNFCYLNKVELLLRVHHRHLVGLVGYCDDGDYLALIYEYMANGDLRENMSGKHN